MITIDYNFLLTGADENPLKDRNGELLKASMVLAESLFQTGCANVSSLKVYDWCTSLYRNGLLAIDKTDALLLEKGIESLNLIVGVRAQLLRKLQEGINNN